MRLPRFHLRLRTLLIAVAVAGLALGGWQMWKRRESCLKQSAMCDGLADFYGQYAAENEARFTAIRRSGFEAIRGTGPFDKLMSYGRRESARYHGLAAAYRHVARYPWLPMPREPA